MQYSYLGLNTPRGRGKQRHWAEREVQLPGRRDSLRPHLFPSPSNALHWASVVSAQTGRPWGEFSVAEAAPEGLTVEAGAASISSEFPFRGLRGASLCPPRACSSAALQDLAGRSMIIHTAEFSAVVLKKDATGKRSVTRVRSLSWSTNVY